MFAGARVDDFLTAKERAELAALRRMRAPVGTPESNVETLTAFIKRRSPHFTPAPHLEPLIRLFERSRTEEIRALVTYPPRHGKTETIGHGLAWRILTDPAAPNAYATFGLGLATKTSRKVRKLVRAAGMPLAKDRNTVLDWRTTMEGGLKATSLGGGITGEGFKGGLIVVDDAIKGRKHANSRKRRDEVWDWLADDVFSRAEGGTGIIVNATRWHEDDPHGRILAGQLNQGGHGRRWEVIHMPAVMGPDGAPIDERLSPDLARPLWPGSEWDLARLAEIRARGEYGWWSLYQGMPRSKEGKLFPGEPTYFTLADHRWDGWRAVIVMDPAASESTAADYTAIGLFAMKGYGIDSVMRVIRAHRAQVAIPTAAEMALTWQRQYRVLLAVEAQGAFVAIPQMLRKAAPGLRIFEIKNSRDARARRVWLGDKFTRAQPASGAWKDPRGRRIEFPIGESWVPEFIGELNDFTGLGDPHDDQVDILAHAWNTLYLESPAAESSAGEVEAVY